MSERNHSCSFRGNGGGTFSCYVTTKAQFLLFNRRPCVTVLVTDREGKTLSVELSASDAAHLVTVLQAGLPDLRELERAAAGKGE
jgi:hypothetical protein